MKYILTGAAGFIGFHTAKALLDRGDTVFGIDSLNSYYDPRLKEGRLGELGIRAGDLAYGTPASSEKFPRLSFTRINLEDAAAFPPLFDRFAGEGEKPGGVIHLAAQAGVRYSLENPGAYIDSNLRGFFNVLEGCRRAAVPHLVYASSSSVYGLNRKRPFSVHDRTDHPVSLYAATKKSNELLAHSYAHLFGLPVTGLRFFTVYGPWGRPDMAYYKFSALIREGKPIDVYNRGEMYRDFTYIDDVTAGVLAALDRPPEPDRAFDPARPDPASSSAPYRIYNLGNNRPECLNDFIAALEELLGKPALRNELPLQDGDVPATEADIEDSIRDLGWRPRTDLKTGLAAFTRWFLGYHP
jgi:UDP-glucuronate 4-epimerase